MGGGSKPGSTIHFKVLTKVGKHILIEVPNPEEEEYLKPDTWFIGTLRPRLPRQSNVPEFLLVIASVLAMRCAPKRYEMYFLLQIFQITLCEWVRMYAPISSNLYRVAYYSTEWLLVAQVVMIARGYGTQRD